MSFTKVEQRKLNTYKKVSIKPYFDPSIENMGLQNYGMALHEGVYWTEQLACLERNGVKRYVTGLNEFAPEVKLIENKEEREAKIKDIRTTVAQLEKELAANVLDPEDPEFWNKVKLLRPDNDEFWSRIELKAGNDTTFMDPMKDPYDLIKIYAIDAGGFSIVAPSLRAAQSLDVAPKFYLDRHEETVSTKNVLKKLKNKAIAILQDMFDTDTTKMLYVAKVIDPGSSTFTKKTSHEDLYSLLDDYINGLGIDKDKKFAAQNFVDVASQSIGDLKIRAIIKDASFYKIIATKADGYIYHLDSGTVLGKTPADVLEFLKNPLNEDILVNIQEPVEDEWNK